MPLGSDVMSGNGVPSGTMTNFDSVPLTIAISTGNAGGKQMIVQRTITTPSRGNVLRANGPDQRSAAPNSTAPRPRTTTACQYNIVASDAPAVVSATP